MLIQIPKGLTKVIVSGPRGSMWHSFSYACSVEIPAEADETIEVQKLNKDHTVKASEIVQVGSDAPAAPEEPDAPVAPEEPTEPETTEPEAPEAEEPEADEPKADEPEAETEDE